MTDSNRRGFLRAVGTAAGATAALTTFPPVIARALSIPAARRTGTLADVEHIVILTQENRSFDHYFGTLNGVRGFADRFPIPVPDAPSIVGKSVWYQPNQSPTGTPAAIAPFRLNTLQQFAVMRVEGTPHSWTDAQFAWNEGRMSTWPRIKQNHSLGYYAKDDMPFQWSLVNAFTVCDAYHCAIQAGTNPNRLFIWTGTNDPLAKGNGPARQPTTITTGSMPTPATTAATRGPPIPNGSKRPASAGRSTRTWPTTSPTTRSPGSSPSAPRGSRSPVTPRHCASAA